MIKRDYTPQIRRLTHNMRSNWQIFFLPGVIIYALSLSHLLYGDPYPRVMGESLRNGIDQISFIAAVALAAFIMNMKRIYFSKRYTRLTVEFELQKHPEKDVDELLKSVFRIMQSGMNKVWLLGGLLILIGVCHYWITLLPQNMHIYFAVGALSLLINYPRVELFADIPWYVAQERKSIEKGIARDTGN